MNKPASIALTALLAVPSFALQAARIGLDQVPAAVMAGLRQEHPEAKDLEVDKETHFGLTLYEMKFKEQSGHEHQTLLDPDGKPFGHEEPIDPDALPPAVKKSLKGLFSSVEVKDVEAIHHPDGQRIEYEIDVRGDGADWEIAMDPEGKVLVKEAD